MDVVLLIHAATTWALVGLIWIVQLVHYPLFRSVGRDRFQDYHARHTRAITWVVAPLMFTELGTAVVLLVGQVRDPWLLASLVPLAFNWLSTWWIQIPQHHRLSAGFDEAVHGRLVRLNWLRTVSWSLRGALVLVAAMTFGS